MANPWQSAEAGRINYAGSALQQRNQKLQRAAQIAPVRRGDDGCERFDGVARVMTAAEFVANGDAVMGQIDAGREAHLLVRDEYNPGEFLPVPIYDVAIKQERNRCEFDLHAGAVLVKPDTLVYWK